MDKTIKDKEISVSEKMSDNEQMFIEYSVKKAEKISSAIYVLSNFIPSSDPMRHSIRKSSLRLLSDIFTISSVSDIGNGARASVFVLTSQIIPEILSLISVSKTSGFISPMNASVVSTELKNFQNTLEDRFGLKEALLLSKKDFDIPAIEEIKAVSTKNTNTSNKPLTEGFSQKKSSYVKGPRVYKVATKKTERRSVILETLKNNKEIGVKDVLIKLPQYSEKTIQRELLKMVSEGILKREGERRWSRYSMV